LKILKNYENATKKNDKSYKAHHSFALLNSIIIHNYETKIQKNIDDDNKELHAYIVNAINGYFKSISLSQSSFSQQDILRLLTLWFKYGQIKPVETSLIDGFETVNIDTWLLVIPQLIARVHSDNISVKRLVHDLLSKIGKAHPQALIYPFTVCAKSKTQKRRAAAETLLDKMRIHSSTLVDQALLVSDELIRIGNNLYKKSNIMARIMARGIR
jgi:FKBP12-rapamycin complex-associated protein